MVMELTSSYPLSIRSGEIAQNCTTMDPNQTFIIAESTTPKLQKPTPSAICPMFVFWKDRILNARFNEFHTKASNHSFFKLTKLLKGLSLKNLACP